MIDSARRRTDGAGRPDEHSRSTPQDRPRSTGRNNFTALRLVAASLVVFSHAVELPTGMDRHDWMFRLTGEPLSWYAVNIFFVISGYLIFASWERYPSLLPFFWARALRIFPGLFIMLLVTVIGLGVACSALQFSNYITNGLTYRYLFGSLSIVFVKYELPGVFSGNPISTVNGSLWTLRYELLCYAYVAAVGMFCGLSGSTRWRKTALWAGLLLCSVSLVWFDARGLQSSSGKLAMAYELARLAMCFQLGGLYRELERQLPLRAIVLFGLLAVMIAAIGSPLFVPAANIATAYATFWVAFIPRGKWIDRLGSGPDYSYGVYVYAFPIQQGVISFVPGSAAVLNLLVAFPITFLFASLSWHLVERPALSYKRLFGEGSPLVATAPSLG